MGGFSMKAKTNFRQLLGSRVWQISTLSGMFLLVLPPLGLPILAQQSTLESLAPPVSASTPGTETDYTVGAGDRLRVEIFQEEALSGEYVVLVDGTVSLPLAGRIQAEGLTLPEITELMTQAYTSYLRRPQVTVGLVNPRPLKLAISGEVNSPGSYTITLAENQQFPTVTNLIEQAGGLTTTADVRQVQIRRFYQGREQVLRADLWELLVQGSISQDLTLRDGDTVIVPTQDQIDVAQTRQLADASFGIRTNQAVDVAVVGEVYRPGSYQIRPEQLDRNRDRNIGDGNSQTLPPKLTQAIEQAGGIKPLADIRNVAVRRSTRAGTQQTINVNLWQLLQTGDLGEDVILQEGDTIVIPTARDIDPSEAESLASASFSPENIQVNVVGEVEEPGTVQVPPNTPLNQALLAAGGFDDRRANKSTVQLVRLNPNGTVTKRKVEVNLAADINEENNPILRNNDVIVVNRSGLAQVGDVLGTVLSPIGSAFSIFRLLGID